MANAPDLGQLTARIYQAALEPPRWLDVLDSLTEIGGGRGTGLFITSLHSVTEHDPGSIRWLGTHDEQGMYSEWLSDARLLKLNARGERLIPIRQPRFLTDLDAFSEDELDHVPWYRDFLRPRGFGWCVGTAIRSPSEDTVVISIERAYDKGPVEPETIALLDRLRPDLARAALFSAHLGLEKARTTAAAFELLGLAAAVLSQDGRVIAANKLLMDDESVVAIGARDRLRFVGASARQVFDGILQTRSSGPRSLSFAAHDTASAAKTVAHVFPMQNSGLDLFTGARWVLFLTPFSRARSLEANLLQALFDLTPAEARVAAQITEGHSVGLIATTLGVEENTVRAHLKSIFVKTGTERQAELVSLLSVGAKISAGGR